MQKQWRKTESEANLSNPAWGLKFTVKGAILKLDCLMIGKDGWPLLETAHKEGQKFDNKYVQARPCV